MEVVIIIGHHPAITIGACSTGDINDNELELIGGLLGEPLQVTPAETVDIPVPARAEIAIEGVIDPRNMGTDGPFGEFTHYYGPETSCYIIKVTAITMRRDAIYHDLDNAHREHNFCSLLPNESHTFDVIKRAVPTVQAVHLPWTGLCEFHMYASIKKRLQGEGKFAGLAAITANAEAKLAVVVDEDVDVYDEEDVLWAITTRVQADQDVTIIPWVSGADLDPSCYDETRIKRGAMTTKMIIDATKPVGAPFAPRITPPKALWDSMKLDDYLK
jgi:2,5-furandicarboxylate decarboxylase 1